jgi:hypothetical protein
MKLVLESRVKDGVGERQNTLRACGLLTGLAQNVFEVLAPLKSADFTSFAIPP